MSFPTPVTETVTTAGSEPEIQSLKDTDYHRMTFIPAVKTVTDMVSEPSCSKAAKTLTIQLK